MIIPLSHDSGEVRRQPWVTYGIILSCVLVFLVTHVFNRDISADAERLVREAVEYWAAHPYLEAPPRLAGITGDPGSAAREDFYALWESSGEPPIPVSTLDAEQKRLDELTERAFAALEKHPWYRFGLIPAAPTATGLFAHMFLHGGWLHLIPNLLFLFLTGSFIEDRWGRGLYTIFYLAAGVAGATLFVAKNPGFEGPLIGASGAIAGAMGAFLVCFARAKIKFFYWLGLFFGTFSAPAWLMLPLWFANEFFAASLMDAVNPGGGGGGVAYWAHVGGFGFGVVVALGIRFSGIEARLSKRLDNEWTCDHDSVLADALTARAEGRGEEALELLRLALEGDPHHPDLALAFFETAVGLGRLEEGSAALAAAVWREVRAGEREVAISHWLALCQAGARVSAEPALLFRLAGWLRDAKNTDAASAALRCALETRPADPIVAMRVARLARGFDPVTALEAAEIALQTPGLEPAERDALEAIVAGSGAQVEGSEIALESPAPEEGFDPGVVDLHAISPAPEPEGPEGDPEWPSEFDRGVVDLSEISVEAQEPEELSERVGAFHEPPALEASGDHTELFDAGGVDLSEKEEPEIYQSSVRRALRVVEAIPRELEEGALWLDVDGKGHARLPLSRVDAVAVAGVHGLSRRAVILIDLALDWTADAEKPLTVLRLRSDRYDPRTLVGDAGSPLQATRQFVSALIAGARALALPDPGSARGEPFRIFRDLAGYEEQVLRAERPAVDDIF
jgi:membrane associated rhomboid family serine protease/tetratricopeptide (TPR) repeat protein